MTQERSGGEPHVSGDAGAPETEDDREARLRALLSVPVGVVPSPTTSAPSKPRPRSPGRPTAPVPGGGDHDDAGGRSGTGLGVRSVLSALVLLALFATGAGLAYAGSRIIRSSTEGEVLAEVTDPAAPGYEALVTPTPTMLLIHDVDGDVNGLTVLTLPSAGTGGGGGGVVFVPTRTVADLPLFGVAPIEVGYDLGSPGLQAEFVGDIVTTGIEEVTVVDADRWAGLVAPVAPLSIDNPDDLEVDGEVLFPAGDLELEAEDVGAYLAAQHDGESDLARLFRHRTFWMAWLDAVARSDDPAAVPGELESGIGRFVRALASGPVEMATLPVEATTGEDDEDEPTFLPEDEEVAALIAELVPLPRSPRPGVRPRVRVLAGTEDLDQPRSVALELPPTGVEVVIVGNASSFDEQTTTIAYVNPEHEEAAEAIRDVLGVGEVMVDPRPSDVVDITVTLGADHD